MVIINNAVISILISILEIYLICFRLNDFIYNSKAYIICLCHLIPAIIIIIINIFFIFCFHKNVTKKICIISLLLTILSIVVTRIVANSVEHNIWSYV